MTQTTSSEPSEYECDDTAYPAAAMPGECTRPPENGRSDDELERREAHIRISGTDPNYEEAQR